MENAAHAQVQPLISVITVCLNEAPTRIKNTFSSIAAQSYKHIEHIVLDGGSVEETLEAIREFAGKATRFISESDQGLYDAMNKGVRLSRGDLLIFMNVGDQFLTGNVLADMVESIRSNPGYDYCYGDVVRLEVGSKRFVSMPRLISKFYMYESSIYHQTVLSQRELFDRIGYFDISYFLLADQDWLLRAMATGARGLHTGVTVCEFEIGGACNAWRKLSCERKRMQRQHYHWGERLLFGLVWIALKTARRLRTGNFATPVGWQK